MLADHCSYWPPVDQQILIVIYLFIFKLRFKSEDFLNKVILGGSSDSHNCIVSLSLNVYISDYWKTLSCCARFFFK